VKIDIGEYFSDCSYEEWLATALKSLKLDSDTEFEQKMNYKTLEGVVLKPYYADQNQSIHLASFPSHRELVRFGHENKAFEQDLIDRFFVAKQNYYNVIETNQNHSQWLNMTSLLQECHFDQKVFLKKLEDNVNDNILFDLSFLHNAGASIVQEIAFLFSCLDLLKEKVKGTLWIGVAVDSLYFNNIAKLRAIRFMQESLHEQCGFASFKIISIPSQREQTLYDPWVNMLRTTVTTSVGFIGGADLIAVTAYNQLSERVGESKINDMGLRQSRNIFRILDEESFLAKVADPSEGSYAIESLTCEYISLAFELIKDYESKGGVLAHIKTFAQNVESIATLREKNILKRKTTIVGVNDFSQTDESLRQLYGQDISFKPEEGLFPLRRPTKKIEQLRYKLETKKLQITILAYGVESKLSGRISFCKNYFEVLGKEVEVCFIDKVETPSSDVFVLCALDDEYEDLFKQIKLDESIKYFIAGKKYKKEGCQNIYQGQDIYEVLSTLFKEENI
jgi:hypothetical protein